MRIAVAGTRGIPEIQGGIETHCQELYPRLAAMGHEVTVYRRRPYTTGKAESYKGVKLRDLPAPRSKSLEAIAHTFLAIIAARRRKAEIMHIHGIGPSLLAPLARLAGMKVVVTNHGADYRRRKWGRIARAVLKAGEAIGTKSANEVIAVSAEAGKLLAAKYGRKDVRVIHNGVTEPARTEETAYITSLGLEKGKYLIGLGRFVAEKGFHELIEAWSGIDDKQGFSLVIAGDADHPDSYSRRLKERAAEAGVIMPGFVKGEKLNELMSHARVFVMPSSHEGLPIALLEAMSYRLDAVTSDIEACRLPQLAPEDHYPLGDINALRELLRAKISHPADGREYDLSDYDWDKIAKETERVYEAALESQRAPLGRKEENS